MYPFDTKRQWYLAGKATHILQAFEQESNTLRKSALETGALRAKSLKKLMKIQMILFVFFYFSFVTTAFSWIAQYWDKLSALDPFMDAIAEYVSTLSVVILVGIFVVRRQIGVLEANLLLLLAKPRLK